MFDAMSVYYFSKTRFRHVLKKNPLKNTRIMTRLNPFAPVQKKNAILAEERQKEARQRLRDSRRGVSFPSS